MILPDRYKEFSTINFNRKKIHDAFIHTTPKDYGIAMQGKRKKKKKR